MPKKGLRFLAICWLQNRCSDQFLGVIFFLPTSEICDTCICSYWNQTKFPTHKVWWIREAAQIGQTFIPLCEKVQFCLHLDIVLQQKKRSKVALPTQIWQKKTLQSK